MNRKGEVFEIDDFLKSGPKYDKVDRELNFAQTFFLSALLFMLIYGFLYLYLYVTNVR